MAKRDVNPFTHWTPTPTLDYPKADRDFKKKYCESPILAHTLYGKVTANEIVSIFSVINEFHDIHRSSQRALAKAMRDSLSLLRKRAYPW